MSTTEPSREALLEEIRKLKSEKDNLRALIDNIPEIIYFMDANGKYMDANKSAIHGLNLESLDQLKGKTLHDFFEKNLADLYSRSDREVLESGVSVIEREEPVTRDPDTGFERYWVTTKVALKDDNGTTIGIVGITKEITEFKNANKQLEEDKQQLRLLIDNIPDYIFFIDKELKYINANRAVIENFRMKSIDEIVGKSAEDFMDKSIAKNFLDEEREILLTGKAIHQKENIGMNSNGKRIYMQTTKIPIKDAEGNVSGIVGISRNISALKKAHKQLEKQSAEIEEQNTILQLERNQLQTLIDTLPEVIYIKNTKSQFLIANKALMELREVNSLDDLMGKTDHDLFPKELADEYRKDEIELIRSKQPILGKEEPGLNLKGETIYRLVTKVPLLNPAGEVIGIVGSGKDITEIKKASKELENTLTQLRETQSQLVQSEKMASLGVLTAGIAHEINNPVNFVYAGVNSMIRDFEDMQPVIEAIFKYTHEPQNAAQHFEQIAKLIIENQFEEAYNATTETLEDVREGSNRIAEIVAGMSKYSTREKDEWRTVDLHEEINNVLLLLKNKYKNRIKVSTSYSDELPKLECYPVKLNQAILNIVNNAIDAIVDKGTITISTTHIQNKITISIQDTGMGMSEEVKSKLFDPFYTTKDVGKGTGLGMSITHTIIQDHHGKITVDSAEGEGSTFAIELPIFQNKQ